MGFTGKIVKTKWKNLKDKFRIELRKVLVQYSNAEYKGYKSKWPFFDMMLFVKDIITSNLITGNLSSMVEQISIVYSNEKIATGIEEISDTKTEMLSSTAFINYPQSSFRNIDTKTEISHKKAFDEKSEEKYLEIAQLKSNLSREERKRGTELISNLDYNFLMSLLPYLEKLNTLEKLEVRGKMQNVVIEIFRRKSDTSIWY